MSCETLPPAWAVQDPEEYIDVLRQAVPAAIEDAGIDPATVVGIGTDFTACTIMPTTSDETPRCRLDEFRDRPHAPAADAATGSGRLIRGSAAEAPEKIHNA